MTIKLYEGFSFSEYLKKFLDRKDIKLTAVSKALDINYRTCQSKMRNDGFKYNEIIFLDIYFNLQYIENFKKFLELRGFRNEVVSNIYDEFIKTLKG